MVILGDHQWLNYLVRSPFMIDRATRESRLPSKMFITLYLISTLSTFYQYWQQHCANGRYWHILNHRDAWCQSKLFWPASCGKIFTEVYTKYHHLISTGHWGAVEEFQLITDNIRSEQRKIKPYFWDILHVDRLYILSRTQFCPNPFIQRNHRIEFDSLASL